MGGKFIVVSGGTKGIGRAILEKFAEESFDVATCARTKKDLDAMERQWSQRFPGSVLHTFCGDLSDRTVAAKFCQSVLSLKRPVDIVVNNSGVFIPGRIIDEEEGILERTLAQNLLSAYYLTRGLIKGMIAKKSGHIFNMCSIASLAAYPDGGSYTISKFALLGFSKSLREELKPHGIRVTSVIPGATLTESWKGTQLPETRFMRPSDVAEAVFSTWSLSPQSVVEEIVIRPQLGDI